MCDRTDEQLYDLEFKHTKSQKEEEDLQKNEMERIIQINIVSKLIFLTCKYSRSRQTNCSFLENHITLLLPENYS